MKIGTKLILFNEMRIYKIISFVIGKQVINCDKFRISWVAVHGMSKETIKGCVWTDWDLAHERVALLPTTIGHFLCAHCRRSEPNSFRKNNIHCICKWFCSQSASQHILTG